MKDGVLQGERLRPGVQRRRQRPGRSDRGRPQLHQPGRRRHRHRADRRRRLGRRAPGGQGRRHPGDPRGPHGHLVRRPLRQLGRRRLQEGGRAPPASGRPTTSPCRPRWSSSRAPPGSAPANDRADGLRRARSTAPASRRSTPRPATSPATAARPSWRASSRSTASTASTWSSPTTTTWRSVRSRRSRLPAATPGEDIKIVSIDAVQDGMQALVDGKINFIVECNPLLGEQAAEPRQEGPRRRRRREAELREGRAHSPRSRPPQVIDSRPY